RKFHSSRPNSTKDPYQVLGVPRDASPADIKKKYYEFARKHHPDTNPDPKSKDRFVEIQAAWDILGDEKKRATYDQYGAASQQQGFDPNAFGGQNPFGAGFNGFDDFLNPFGRASGRSAPENILETLFGGQFGGGGRPRGEASKGGNLEAKLTVSFTEACKGTTKTVNVTPIVDCHTCDGSGLKKGAQKARCGVCGGTGTRTFVISSGFQMAATCTACQGTGQILPKGSQCNSCDGIGKVKERRSVTVQVPPGVEDGAAIRVTGSGDMPLSGRGSPGDLIVRVHVVPSKQFRRQGMNLFHQTKIPLHAALLGGRVRVPTLDGEVELQVPAGTQPGEEAILKGRGVPHLRDGYKGDLYVSFAVQLPRSLTSRQREILKQFADELEGRTSSTSGSSSTPSSPPTTESTSSHSNTTNSSAESQETQPLEDQLNNSESLCLFVRLHGLRCPPAFRTGGGGGWLGWLGRLKDAMTRPR
ncbi:uncharacterized protein EI90DRAFT_2902436, partial [Cantharellus anzutake]|uniref:uncharacterized protein n=1 Tax=Cantharellus anzutake TaxID=1750568 RepID=UPI001907DC6D